MTTAEKLARQVRRVAELRGKWGERCPFPATIDSLLERACRAIGSGDDGRMEAVGLELEAVQ